MNITTSSHGYKHGDMIEIKMLDNRKWKRFIHWITFRNPPMITMNAKVGTITETMMILTEGE